MSIHGLVLVGALLAASGPTEFTILHTNDWQSRFLGFGPNAEYSPASVLDDSTRGGIARLATLLERLRSEGEARGPVLVLDGGDWTMGTLFHTISRETGAELQLMKRLGYDAITIGNHEFDFGPDGLASMIHSAKEQVGELPAVVSANIQFSKSDPTDDKLHGLFKDGTIKPSVVIERGGIRFGVLGLMGLDAEEVSRGMGPVNFADPVETARQVARRLRAEENVDVVIAVSHGGVVRNAEGQWVGEDVLLATAVPGIDVVVGGHSHTPLKEPIVAGRGLVVQAGSDSRYLGELRMRWTEGGPELVSYTLHPIDDSIPGDALVTAEIEGFKRRVTEEVLAPRRFVFDEVLFQTTQTLSRSFDDYVLGNLVTDALRRAAGADVAFTGNGTIRDEIHKGQSGIQRVSDLFRVAPLGIGELDDEPGYPIATMYVTGKELKNVLEVLTFAYEMKGPSYYPRLSGVRFTYNEFRVPLDRIMTIELGDLRNGYRTIDVSGKDPTLYSIATTTYVGSFLGVIDELSHGLLTVTPKDQKGAPLGPIRNGIVDGDPSTEGVQEIKEWQALLEFMRNLKDTTGDGIPDITSDPVTNERRMLAVRSLSPMDLTQNATYLMGTVTALFLLLGCGILWILRGMARRLRR